MAVKPPKARRSSAPKLPRLSPKARGYDAEWRRLRAAFIAANPICTQPGCGASATDVDHIQSVKKRPDLRLVWGNLRSFCHAHHSGRTARDQGFARRRDDLF